MYNKCCMLSHLETAIANVSCSDSVKTRCIFLFTIRHSCQIWCVFSFMVCLSLVSDQVYIIVPGLSDYSVWSFIFSRSLPVRLFLRSGSITLRCLIRYLPIDNVPDSSDCYLYFYSSTTLYIIIYILCLYFCLVGLILIA
jgi:hypothetical protein